jgi:SOS regulatory protein LexA
MDTKDSKQKIFAFYEKQKRMPSYQEIMELVGFKSKNAVHKLVNRMVEEGIVAKDERGRLIPAFGFGEVPLLGLVEAGIPSVAEENMLEAINLDSFLIPHKEKTFLLEVKGQSMIEAHIDEGDMVIAERAETAREGDIVVAEVDGEWTLKYFHKEHPKTGKPWLEPANKDFKPIHPKQSLRIAAIVRGVIRKY